MKKHAFVHKHGHTGPLDGGALNRPDTSGGGGTTSGGGTGDITGLAAGGDLSGTYPNPEVVDDSHNHTSATVTAGATATDAYLWRPLLDGAGANVTDGSGQAVMAFGPA